MVFNAGLYDVQAAEVGGLPRIAFRSRLKALSSGPGSAMTYVRSRCRWRVDEFADLVMRGALKRIGPVSDPNDIDDFIYGLPPGRAGCRRSTTQRMMMTGRGVGKTTRLKIRALHGLLFGCTRVAVAIGASDEEAIGWVDTIRSWLENPPPALVAMFPALSFNAAQKKIAITTRFGTSYLLARSFTGAMRGMNVQGRRPDAIYLDDIEGEDKSITVKARDRNQIRLTKKVLPLIPLEGGAEIWWVQTPVHHDCVAVRAFKGAEELRGWTCRRVRVVKRWPECDPEGKASAGLWAANKKIYFDVDRYGEDQDARTEAAHRHYAEHQAEMDAGCIVLDPVRMPIDVAYRKRWDVGETAWSTEFEIDIRAPGAGVFEPDTWPRYRWIGADRDIIRINGRELAVRAMKLSAHYDPSDGGDDGALVVVGKLRGRFYVLEVRLWEGAKLSQQIAAIPDALRHWVSVGLKALQWEPTTGSASVVEREIVTRLKEAGVYVAIDRKHSTERKESRIVATLEPKASGGLLAVSEGFQSRHEAQIADFNASQRDNRDDLLDALQRAVERLEAVDGAIDAETAATALRRAGW